MNQEENTPKVEDLDQPDLSALDDGVEVTAEMVEGPQEQPERPAVPVGEVIAVVAKVAFGFVASRKGEHWKLSDGEAQELGQASGEVINKYYPEVETGPELTLVAVAGAIAIPRLMTDKQLALEAEQKRKEAAQNGETEPQSAE